MTIDGDGLRTVVSGTHARSS